MKNDRERTLHRNMLFPLGLQCDIESVLEILVGLKILEILCPNRLLIFLLVMVK